MESSDQKKKLLVEIEALGKKERLLAEKIKATPEYQAFEKIAKQKRAELIKQILKIDEMLMDGVFDEDIINNN